MNESEYAANKPIVNETYKEASGQVGLEFDNIEPIKNLIDQVTEDYNVKVLSCLESVQELQGRLRFSSLNLNRELEQCFASIHRQNRSLKEFRMRLDQYVNKVITTEQSIIELLSKVTLDVVPEHSSGGKLPVVVPEQIKIITEIEISLDTEGNKDKLGKVYELWRQEQINRGEELYDLIKPLDGTALDTKEVTENLEELLDKPETKAKKLIALFWEQEYDYFEGFWWQDVDKLKDAITMLWFEIEKFGPLQVNTLGNLTIGDRYINAIQALANAPRTGYYDDATIAAIENSMTTEKREYTNHSIDLECLEILSKRYSVIKGKKLGNTLERGWGDVFAGLIMLGESYFLSNVVQGKYDGKVSNAKAKVKGKIKQTLKTWKLNRVKDKASSVLVDSIVNKINTSKNSKTILRIIQSLDAKSLKKVLSKLDDSSLEKVINSMNDDQINSLLRKCDGDLATRIKKISEGGLKTGIDESFSKLDVDIDNVDLPEGTWNKRATDRGKDIDEIMNNNVGQNYPVIDKIDENGVVTSVKSRDLNCKTYQNGSNLEKTIKKDIDKVANFDGADWNGVDIEASDITGRQLQIVVPNTTLSDAQIKAINNAIQYGKSKGVKVIITIGG